MCNRTLAHDSSSHQSNTPNDKTSFRVAASAGRGLVASWGSERRTPPLKTLSRGALYRYIILRKTTCAIWK